MMSIPQFDIGTPVKITKGDYKEKNGFIINFEYISSESGSLYHNYRIRFDNEDFKYDAIFTDDFLQKRKISRIKKREIEKEINDYQTYFPGTHIPRKIGELSFPPLSGIIFYKAIIFIAILMASISKCYIACIRLIRKIKRKLGINRIY